MKDRAVVFIGAASVAVVVTALVVGGTRPEKVAVSGNVLLTEVAWGPGGFVRLQNTGSAPVSLLGWRILGDVRFRFERDVVLPPGGSVFVRSPKDAKAPPDSLRWWRGKPRKKRGWLALYDATPKRVDRVSFGRWPGPGKSIQRVPDTPFWTVGAPTPGAPAVHSLGTPRLAMDSAHCGASLARSKRPVAVSVRVHASEPVHVRACWSTSRTSGEVPLVAGERDGSAQWYRGEIPPAPDQVLVRVRFVAEAGTALVELSHDDEGRSLDYFVCDGIDTPLPVYCFEFSQDRVKELLEGPERVRFPATLVVLDGGRPKFMGEVTVQVRGGTWTRAWVKKNWVVNFPRDAREDGVRQINLRSEWHDPTSLRELLGYELYHESGVPAPLARHVRLQINGEPAGLFLEVEQVDCHFLARNGLVGASLYKAVVARDQSGPERCDGRVYPTRSGFEAHWRLSSRGTSRGHARIRRPRLDEPFEDLEEFVDGFHACRTAEELHKFFDRHLDVERYVNYLAVNSFMSHWDSAVKNFYWCQDPETGRFLVIPWDLDRTWGDHFEGWSYATAPPLEGTRDMPTDPGGRDWWNWLQDRFLSVPEYRDRALTRIVQLTIDCPATRLDPEINAKIAALRKEILLDRTRWGSYKSGHHHDTYERGPFGEEDLARGVEQLKSYVHGRLGSLRRSCTDELARDGYRPPAPPEEAEAKTPSSPAEGTRWILLLPCCAFLYLTAGYGSEERL